MRIAWFLVVFGGSLLVEGTLRIVLAIIDSNVLLALGGILTGWLLGGWLLRKGIRRFKAVKIG